MALPVKTTLEDVEALLAYLKPKALGVPLKEARAVLDKKLLDGRKLSALEFWEIISREGDRLVLTQRGRKGARSDEDKVSMFREILSSVRAYRTATDWAFQQGLPSVEAVDVAARWNLYNQDEVETDNERTLRENVICFFHLAQGAALGQLLLGRKGAPTRFQWDRAALRSFLEAPEISVAAPEVEEALEPAAGMPEEAPAALVEERKAVREPSKPIIFISHGRNKAILADVKKMVELAGFEYIVAVEEETTAIPVPQKVMRAMKKCNAAVINVSADEPTTDSEGKVTFQPNINVSIEIGAAQTLYSEDRIILLWDKRVQVPSNLEGLYRCEYEGDRLDLNTGMKLLEALAKFRP